MDKKKIVIIAGPTASGKSSLAVSAAELIGGEIISCDSMQIYTYMDIGTAKITREEMRGVPHYMLDLVDPRSEYSVSEFSREAKALIDKISARSHIPVLVGGTGLYIESIIYPLSFVVNKDDGVRKRLFEEYEKYGAEVMHERLLKIDPADAAKIHPHNVKRLLRALEIYELSGKTKSEQDERTIDPSYDIKLCVMIPERAELYENIEKPLIFVLYDMERTGVRVDRSQLTAFADDYHKKLLALQERIFAICGGPFNINSPSQLGQVLFEKLGLKSGKKNKNGKYSTSAEILEKLADQSEAARLVLEYRQYQKLLSTYIEGFKPLIDGGLIHTTYNQTVTITGRLSSTNPNLQNIPIREDEGRELRKLFIPREGNVFIDADYSQIELRLLAHFSGCKELIQAYNEGRDIHAVTASQVFGVPLELVTPKMRSEAKAVNFGIIYGISDFGLSRNLNIPLKVAREYIENYFKSYSAVHEYMQSNVEFARQNGFVSTLTGRKRYIREINSSNYNMRQFGERAAMNMPLQGSSADIIKIAMINVVKALKNEGLKAKLILQVHDELVLDCPEEEAQSAAGLLKREMENAVKLNVPLKVDVNIGKNWYEAK